MSSRSAQESYQDFMDRVMPQLELHGAVIARDARAGDVNAMRVMANFATLYSRFDPELAATIESAFTDWLATRTVAGGPDPDSEEPTR